MELSYILDNAEMNILQSVKPLLNYELLGGFHPDRTWPTDFQLLRLPTVVNSPFNLKLFIRSRTCGGKLVPLLWNPLMEEMDYIHWSIRQDGYKFRELLTIQLNLISHIFWWNATLEHDLNICTNRGRMPSNSWNWNLKLLV